jgi:glycosyltransferase involved in cell wall biosynthesis
LKFCFFGNISGALKGQTPGGGELQVCLLAKALALKGHEVIIIDPYSSESFITPEGVKVCNIPEWNEGWRGMRLFLYRIPALWRILAKQKADYYYGRMRAYLQLIPYMVAKKTGGKFVQAIASDIDVLSAGLRYKYEYKLNFNLLKFLTEHLPNDLVFDYLLKKSDYITLQHSGQKFISTSSKSNQVIFSNIIDLSCLPVAENPSKNYFIYAGSLTMLKGADYLLKLINIIDESIAIVVVGLPQGEKPKEIYEELRKKKNVILKGRKSHKETLDLISNAKALINTSYYEGFPNIYLEAWGTGVPVISLTVNPGNIFNKYKLGVCCNSDLNRMKTCMETNETDTFDKAELRAYVKRFHDLKSAADRFLNALDA